MGVGSKNQDVWKEMKENRIHKFVGDQLSRWPLACSNFRALKNVRVKGALVGGLEVKLQFNPARMISSAAKLSKEDIARRPCFLCRQNRPQEQIKLKFEGRKGKKYDILVNPYPIFPDHLVIAMDRHVDQSIWNRYVDMLDMACRYQDFIFFYNGPKSGASAPDHHHFQAAPRGLMPLENDINELLCRRNRSVLEYVSSVQDASLYHYDRFTTGVFVIESDTSKSAAKLFYRLLDCADVPAGEPEPLINLLSFYQDGKYCSIVVFRKSHRSHHYFSDGPDHLTMSPGCADMAGVFIVPIEKEYEQITDQLLSEMVSEVSISREEQEQMIRRLTRKQPDVEVGVMSAKEIAFEIISDGAGERKAVMREGKIEYDGVLYDELYFEAQTPSTMLAQPSFILHDVTIGVGFHWERKENQTFAGSLKIVVNNGQLTAINVVGVEDYLLSVISSEMKATASEEFLKAHAVISRSWLMSQIRASKTRRQKTFPSSVNDLPQLVSYLDSLKVMDSRKTDNGICEYVKWYDHEDHRLFDVCADDHCQRYQGLTRAVGANVRKVIDETWGQILIHEGEICDARFSKCCGGRMEVFSSCWEDKDYPYLRSLPDTPGHCGDDKAFCDTDDKEVLAQVLNDYDTETPDFFEWRQEYSNQELSALIERKSGLRVGRLYELLPLVKGESGRIVKLKITGSESVIIVGKELEIRRILSESHLKSSAFHAEYIKLLDDGTEKSVSGSEEWDRVVLSGKGWGHGVGLCQIGAAMMASKGYEYQDILRHYYPGAEIDCYGNE